MTIKLEFDVCFVAIYAILQTANMIVNQAGKIHTSIVVVRNRLKDERKFNRIRVRKRTEKCIGGLLS